MTLPKVRDLLERKGDPLQLEALTGDVGLDREIPSPEASSPGLALAGYTGALLNATNEPVWSDSAWITALFLFSGISTGMALLMLLRNRVPRTTIEKLTEADNYLMVFELVTLLGFLVTLGAVGARFVYGSPVIVLFGVVIVVGLLAPLVLHWRPRLAGSAGTTSAVAAVLVLIGGFVLRWAVLAVPQGLGL